jgi:hypothetical protein
MTNNIPEQIHKHTHQHSRTISEPTFHNLSGKTWDYFKGLSAPNYKGESPKFSLSTPTSLHSQLHPCQLTLQQTDPLTYLPISSKPFTTRPQMHDISSSPIIHQYPQFAASSYSSSLQQPRSEDCRHPKTIVTIFF